MKQSLLFLILIINVYASQHYAKNQTCKGCHPIIYDEFYDSQHRKSSIYEDEIHKAAWDNHSDKKNKTYTCAKCHTPTDIKLLENLENNKAAQPEKSLVQTQEAISCAYCHSIKDIKDHNGEKSNIMTNEKKFFYAANNQKKNASEVKYEDTKYMLGMIKEKTGSPFHKIDYTNKNYYNANACMGCHADLKNEQNLEMFKVKQAGAEDEKTNCITCHMPEVKGSLSNIKATKKHRYHGFAGAHNKSALLQKYVKFSLKKKTSSFEIGIKNEASHDLFLQPLRVAILEVEILRNEKIIQLETHRFEKTYSKNDEVTSHWLANKIKKNSMIKANQKVMIPFDKALEEKDKVRVTLGFYLVKPEMIKPLKLEKNKVAQKFNILKQQVFDVKP